MFRADDIVLDFKYLSVREIDPSNPPSSSSIYFLHFRCADSYRCGNNNDTLHHHRVLTHTT